MVTFHSHGPLHLQTPPPALFAPDVSKPLPLPAPVGPDLRRQGPRVGVGFQDGPRSGRPETTRKLSAIPLGKPQPPPKEECSPEAPNSPTGPSKP